MTNAIVKQELNVSVWGMIQQIAVAAKDSGKLNLLKPEEAAMKMLVAWENGFPLTSAFGNVHIINNIPSLSPKAIWAEVVIHPEFAGYQEEQLVDAKGAFFGYKITLKRKNGITVTREFTMDDAKRAKLDNKDNWQMYAKNMCYWRALSFAEDAAFPDVTMGVVAADGLGAYVTADGDVIEGSWTTSTQTPPAPSQTQITLQQLVDVHGAEKVFEAAGNKLPGTNDEVQAVAAKLNGGA